MRAYVAGPMSGLPGLNFDLFNRVTADLRSRGIDAVNPVEINDDPTATWDACMRADIAALVTCDAIVLLPGWEQSRGATLEHHVASSLGMMVCMAWDLAPAAFSELRAA